MEKLFDTNTKERLIDDLKVVMADAEALLKATQGDDKFTELRTKAEDSLCVLKARIAETQAEILARAKVAARATDAYVHENPWRIIGAAAGTGLVIGLLIGRR